MNLRIISMPGAQHSADRIARKLEAAPCRLDSRRFPDGEIYLRLLDDVQGCDAVVVAELRAPDLLIPGLLFVADALRDLGAKSVGLVAPYMPYMRQDKRFQPGECISSQSFAKLLSAAFQWIVTVDPHLHRHATLDDIFRVPTAVVPSAPAIAAWVQTQVAHPHLVGPDEESEQWVSQVAALAGCPYTVLRKTRQGDRDVALVLPDFGPARHRTPVVVDDIISSGGTVAAAARRLIAAGFAAPVCVGVHAVFASDATAVLAASGAARVVTCNTLHHASNAIDVSSALAEAVRVEIEALHAGED